MKLKLKKLNEKAIVPSYAKPGDAGLDLTSISVKWEKQYVEHSTGIAVEIPEGYVGLVFPRSSVTKYDLMLKNAVAVIDSNYRGEIKLRFQTFFYRDQYGDLMGEGYKPGDRIGQLVIMPIPTIELQEVEELSETNRGTGGFGSSGA